MDNDNRSSFDMEAWAKGYKKAAEDESLGDLVQNALEEAGIPAQVMGIDDYLAFCEQQERNKLNLIMAELGDETVIKVIGQDGINITDIANTSHSWDVYMNLVSAYKRRGDDESVGKLLGIFPEHSQLKVELQKRLNNTKIETDYDGFESTVGKVLQVECGTRYDILPGAIDFRKHTDEKGLKAEEVATKLVDHLSSKGDVYAEDWEGINQTLDNIRKEFGQEVVEQVWGLFEEKYTDWQSK